MKENRDGSERTEKKEPQGNSTIVISFRNAVGIIVNFSSGIKTNGSFKERGHLNLYFM